MRPLPHLLAASMYPMSPRHKIKNIAANTEATMTAVLSWVGVLVITVDETAATLGVSVVFGVLHCGALRFGTVTPHGPGSTEYCIPYMVIVLSVSCPCSQAVKALFKSAGSAVTSVE